MKKLALLVGAALLLAACGGEDKKSESGSDSPVNLPEVENMKFAFYVEDSIPNHYSYFMDAQSALETKAQAFQQRMMALQQQGQQKLEKYQREQSAGLLSQNQIMNYEKEIGMIQQQIQYMQETEGTQLELEQMNGTYELFERIKKYGKEYAEEHGISVFLSDKTGGQVIFMDPSMDVTMDFIEYMNGREKQITGDSED